MTRQRISYAVGGGAMLLFAVGHTIGHFSDPTAGMSPADLETWKTIEGHTFQVAGGGFNFMTLFDTFSLYLIAFTLVVGLESLWTARREPLADDYLRGRAGFNALLALSIGILTLLNVPVIPPIVLSFVAALGFGAAALLPAAGPGAPR